MVKKCLIAAGLGGIAYYAFGLFIYFPHYITNSACLAVIGLSFYRVELAIYTIIGMLALAMAYHSFELFILYAAIIIIFTRAVEDLGERPEIFILIAGCPILANLMIGEVALPLEFLIIFMTPILFVKERIPLISALACIFTILLGVIARAPTMGNLIIGYSSFSFYTFKYLTGQFYQVEWLFNALKPALATNTLKMFQELAQYLAAHTYVMLQPLVWALASWNLGRCLTLRVSRNNALFNLFGVTSAAGLLIGTQILILRLVPQELAISLPLYVTLVSATALGLLLVWEFRNISQISRACARIRPTKNDIRAMVSATGANKRDMSLQETLKLQVELKQYIKKTFVHNVTALDVDVAGSAKMKEGEQMEDVIYAFQEYWKLVDRLVIGRGGRLVSRAGDGAMYLFPDANNALRAVQNIFSDLDKFNKKKNHLKSPFIIRAGMNSGEVLEDTRNQTGSIFSHVLDLAGHLQKMASPMDVLISEPTYRKLKDKTGFVEAGISEKDKIPYYAQKKCAVKN